MFLLNPLSFRTTDRSNEPSPEYVLIPEDGPKILLRFFGTTTDNNNADTVFNLARQVLKKNRVEFDDISEIVVADDGGGGQWCCRVTLSSSYKVQMLETVERLNRDGNFSVQFWLKN